MDSVSGKPIPVSTNLVGGKDPNGILRPFAVSETGEVNIIGTNAANGTPGAAVPAEATFVAGTDGTDLRGLKTDANGELQVDVLSSALPAGAATETTLAALEAKIPALGPAVAASSLPVAMATDQIAKVSALNSTTTPLLASATWTGAGEDVVQYGNITVTVYSDAASATKGLKLYASPDNVTWYLTDEYTVPAATAVSIQLFPQMRYFKAAFTNDGVAQTAFVLETTFRSIYTKPSSHRIGDSIKADDDAELVAAVITGQTTGGGGGFVNVKVTPSGAMISEVTGTVAATQSGTWNITNVTGTVSLPTGAATETTLAALDTKAGSIDTKLVTTASGLKVDGSAVTQPISAAALPLPAGAATETTLDALNTKVVTTANGIKVDGSAVTQPVSAASLPLPTGAATETTLAAMSAKLPAALGQTTAAGSVSVVLASNQGTVPVAQIAKAKANAPVRNDYASTNVTTSAYVELVASMTSAATEIEIFDSSGQDLLLAVGAAGDEVDQMRIFPGGNGRVPLAIAQSARVAVKAASGTANVGVLLINFYA